MTAVGFTESLKYGGKLFVAVFALAVVGGGGVALGVLVGEEDATWRLLESTSPWTAEFVAGIVLVVLGAFVLLTGALALAYKLVADATAAGVEEGLDSSEALAATRQQRDATRQGSQRPLGVPPEDDHAEETATEQSGEGTDEASSAATDAPAPAEDADPPTDATGPEAPDEGDVVVPDDEEEWSDEWSSPERRDAVEPADAGGETADTVGESGPVTDEPAGDSVDVTDDPSQEGPPREPSAEEIAFGTDPSSADDGPADTDEPTGAGGESVETSGGESVAGSDGEPVETSGDESPAGDASGDALGEDGPLAGSDGPADDDPAVPGEAGTPEGTDRADPAEDVEQPPDESSDTTTAGDSEADPLADMLDDEDS